jgi:hypothetical protein
MHVTSRGTKGGRVAAYTRTTTLDIDVRTAVDTNLKAINALGKVISKEDLDDIKASLEAAYKSLDKSNLKLQAKYFEFGLDDDVYREVFDGNKYAECSSVLKEGRRKLITAAGVLWFDVDYRSGLEQSSVLAAKSKFTKLDLKFDLDASIKHTIDEHLQATSRDYYQILVWRLAGAESFGK